MKTSKMIKLKDKPFYCHAWTSKISDKVLCNHMPCCGYCHGMEAGIKREGSFKTYKDLGLHPLCPDCLIPVKESSTLNTDWYGELKYFKCANCKEIFVSQNKGELEIAARR